ncbi:hypothetical protein TROLL_125 [Bacillus phage Troll]|uniref:Uncharacterized protein n=3 Tax=Caudoviricetes TaxID=2731619 RepID=A0A143FJ08_9CAUD|nr:hypothetical protein TROLL_125 [Bacillus phage Troll]AGT13407.1 hypothetical protein TROLL_125 [Bacillus phage Troll]AMW61736.1 hypothetical protein JUGLONE_122 [Bacillus phage Juglone]QDH49815.1 hypothetical protein BEYONPHE_128 [Bacillus phage Beyonphe]ULF48744.1 hypothetical protein [Bacillus phage BillyBob]
MNKLILEIEPLEDIYILDELCAIKGKRYPVEILNRNEFVFESEFVSWDEGRFPIDMYIPYDYDPTTYRIICKGVKRIGKNE